MKDYNPTFVKLMLPTAAAAIILGWLNHWLLFGIAAWVLMALGLAIGFGPQLTRKPIPVMIIGLFVVYAGLLTTMAVLDDPQGPLNLVLGFPAATAVLVYGVWPTAAAIGIIYGLTFDRTVLPPDRLDEFMRRFGRKDS